jgi:hypothetical protein
VTNMAEDIFNADGSTPPASEAFLEEYVGEGKKFKDVNELAKAYANADKFIPTLQNDLQQTREFIAEKLQEIAEQRNSAPPVQIVETGSNNPAPVAPPNDGEDLDTRIAKALEMRDTQSRFQKNASIVQDVLVEQLGSVDKAAEAVVNKARELGLDPKDMKELAAKSPKAFLATMGVDPEVKPTSSSTPAPSADVDVNKMVPAVKPGSYAHYEQLRKSNPSLYWSQRTQQQLLKDAQTDPDFFKR